MSWWFTTDMALLLAIVAGAVLLLRSCGLGEWAVAVRTTGLIGALGLWLLAVVLDTWSLSDLQASLSVLSFPAGLFLANAIDRWSG